MGVMDRYNERKKKKDEKNTGGKSASGGVAERYEKNQYYQTLDLDSVDDKYIETFTVDANDFFTRVEENAVSYDEANSVLNDLGTRFDTIQGWMSKNKSNFDKKAYTDLSDSLGIFKSSLDNIKNYYSKWDSAEAYNTALKQWQEYYDKWGHYANAADFEEYKRKGAEVSNPSWEDSKTPVNLFGWKPFGEGADVGNMVTFAEANKGKAATASAQAVRGGGGTDEATKLVNAINMYMHDDEKAMYNYLIGKGETEKASEYLEELKDIFKQREGGKIAEQIDDTAFEAAFSALAGIDSFASGVRNLDNYIKGDEADPTTSFQYAHQTMSSNNKGVWKTTNDLVHTIGNMAPSILVGTITGGIGGAVTMGASATGNAYAEMRNLGYDEWQSRGYATLVGASESALSHFLGGISKLGGGSKGIFQTVASKLVPKFDKAIARVAIQLGGNMLDEGLEEAIQAILEPAFKALMTGEDFEAPEWEEVFYSGLLGALSAGVLEGVPSVVETSAQSRQAKKIYGADAQALVTESLEIDPENAHAQRMQARLDNDKKVSGYQLNRLVEQNEATLTAQDKSNIQTAAESRLTELGESGDVSAIAAALTKRFAGEKLTRREQKIIADSQYGRRVSTEMNPANIRSGEYASAWAENIGTERINVEEYSRLVKEAEMTGETTESTGGDVTTNVPKSALLTREGSMPANDQQMTSKLTGKKSLHVDEAAVAADGQAEIGGNKVVLNGLRKNADGSVVVATADNQSADPGDVKYPSKGHALVYENYANIEAVTDNPVLANMDVDTRSMLARAYDPAVGVAAEDYFFGSNLAYQYGFEGIPMNERTITEDSLLSSITKEQRNLAYDLGRKAGKQAAETQEAGIHAAYEKAVEKLGGKGAAAAIAKKNQGKVVLRNGIAESTMTPQQQATYKLAKAVSKATSTNINIYHGMREHGKYNPATGEIWLNINSNISGSSMMAFTLAHELVHMAKQWKPADFKVFADYLFEQYSKKGVSIEGLIQDQMSKAKDNGYTLNEHEAYEEVIADACQRMLLDSNALQKMAAYKEQNPSNWQKIVNKIREFITSIRNLFMGAEPDSMEAELYKSLDEDAKQYLEKLFVDMVMGAGEHMSTIRNAFGKGTVVEVNADGEFTLAKGNVDGATKFLYNDSTWENGGRDTLEAALKTEGFSQEDIDAALTIMDGKHKLVKELAKKFPEQDRINQATITTDLKDGHSVLSALVSNGDYPVNIDLLMVCKKRKAYQRVINRLCETGLIQQATVDALAIAEINKILGKHGFETACLGCFVESRRLRIQEWANTIVKEWNSEVKKRTPDAKAFGFGKGKGKLTPDEVMQLIGELETGGEKNDQGNLNLGQGSAVKRMGVLLDKVPSLRKTLSVEDLITPDGLTALREFDSNLFSMVKSRYGSNSPKFVQEFNPYNHELAKYGKVPSEYKSLREYLYAIGGARMQSFSYFIVENWFDYCQIVADLAAKKLPMHTYTKEITLAKLFGQTGIKINMSLIPDIDRSLGKEYAGLTRNEKGELELIWADKDRNKATGGKSYMQSINFADAIALQNDPRYSANVGTIAVGVSDKHIYMMLDDARIRMVIPYHSSGMNPIFADLMGTSYYKDYTMFQNTTVKQLYSSKGQPVSMKLDKTQTGKLTSGFQFNEVLQELGDARAAAQAYKDWCADSTKHSITIKGETYTAELTPKFDSFSWHDNYYKLLEDFNTYDCITEEAAPQGDVQQIYPEDFDQILKGELTAQETHRQKQVENQAFDKAMGEIETYLQSHTKADTVFYAEQHGVKLSAKDKKLSAEDKRKLAELRKGEKYPMPKANPYDGKKLYENREIYDYDFMIAQDPMTVATMPSLSTVKENGRVSPDKVVKLGLENAKQLGREVAEGQYAVVNAYTKREIIVGQHGLEHGLGGDSIPRLRTNARLSAIGGELVLNAIPINGLRNKNRQATGTYAMACLVNDNDSKTVAIITVEEHTSKVVDIGYVDITHAINGRFLGKKRDSRSSTGEPRYGLDEAALATAISEISIADFLEIVNMTHRSILSDSVLQKLGEERPANGYYTGEALFKTPNSHSMSPRQLLADAFDDLVQSPDERKLMDQYRNNITKVEDVQDRLRKLRGEISRLTKAKGDKAKIAELNKTAKDLADLIDKYDRKLLELEASKPLKDVLARARSAAYQEAKQRNEKALKEYRQQVSERFDRGVEGRRKTEMRKKIRKVIRDLDKILNRGDKKRNVKEDMKDFVAEALSAAEVLFTDNYTNEDIIRNGFGVELSKEESKYLEEARGILEEMSNLPAGSYESWQARQEAEETLKSRLAYRMTKLKDAFFRERQRLNKAEVAEVLSNLADAYAKLENSEYAYVNGAYHEAVYEYLKMLQEDVGGAKVRDMTLGQLEELYKAYTMVLTTVQNANKMFSEDLKQSKEQLANRIMMEVHQAGGEHGLWSKGELARNQASWNNTKPIYAAERTGSPTFVKLVSGLFKGQYNWATDMEEAKAFRQEVAKKYGFKEWDMEKTYKFTSSSGIDFELNLNQIMALYAYAKREQAHEHLLKGGFVFGKNTEVVVTKNGIKRTYLNKSAKAHNISDEIMGEIINNLTKEQKGFVDERQEYLSTTMGGKGNEVSMRMYGVKLFMEKFYFPLRSAGQYKEKAKEAELKQQQGQINIANSGFTHATTPKASNPVILDGFTDVWASHVNEMSMYHSMVLSMEDFRRVYNYASPNMEGQESASVNSFIENAYGDAATGYFDQLYKELNGGAVVDPREDIAKQRIGRFKKASVMLSNSVVVQQFSAIGRAYALIDPKHFIGPKVDKKKHAVLWDELKQYAPIAIIKEMGGFDTHTGLSAKDYLLAEEYGKGERLKGLVKDKQYRNDVMGLLPAKADELTWCAIWEAVKRETKANNPKMDVKSEEFLQKAGERFSEVIEKTQVYDSVLARSANMRSKNGLMQMLTAFMAEPTTTVNMIEDALRKGNKKVIARTFGAVAASIILNNALASIVYAMRDDDEDENFLEKYAQAFTSGMLDDINPMTYYPVLRDIWSLFQGYDIERSDMAIYSDISDSIKRLATQFAKYDPDMDEDDAAKYYKEIGASLMGLLDAGASAFGIPWKNVRRDLMSYFNTIKTFAGGDSTTWNSFVDAIGGAALDSIPIVGLIAGDSKQDNLYDAIISGDKAYVERLTGGYKDQNAINNAIRKGLRENDPRIREAAIAWNADDLEEYMRIAKEIIAEKHFVQDDVVMAIRSEASALAPDAETATTSKAKGLFTAENFAEAISQGNMPMADAIKTDIINTAIQNGKTEEEAEKSFRSAATSGLKELFLAGDVSENQAIDALETYCDKTKDEAMADVQYWSFKQEYPDVYADDQWFDTYYEKVADSGLDIEVYMEYRNTVSTITGEGKKEKRMAVIHNLPISSRQKDALYLAEGWAESKLYEAPWH